MSKIVPVELVSLASIVPPLNHEVSGGFNAMVDGKQVRVRAVLERTVVIEHQEGGERSVVRKDNCMVQPSAVAFVPGNPNNGVGPRQWRRLPGKPPATPRVGPQPESISPPRRSGRRRLRNRLIDVALRRQGQEGWK